MNAQKTARGLILRYIIALLFIVLLASVLFSVSLNGGAAAYAADTQEDSTTYRAVGAGEELDPWLIGNAAQLRDLAYQVNGTGGDYTNKANTLSGKYIRLTADIDLSGYGRGINWQPIGTDLYCFEGSFDGGGFTVSNLYIDITGATGNVYAGLFGYVYNANILNLGVSGTVSVSGSGTIYAAGGITGGAEHTDIINSHSGVEVSAAATGTASVYAGGIAGYGGSFCRIISSYNTGTVKAVKSGSGSYVSAGGIVGYSSLNCYITSGYNIGTIISSAIGGNAAVKICAGGITGYGGEHKGSINNSYNMGAVEASSSVGGASTYIYAGGIAGYNDNGNITNSYNTEKVSVRSEAGAYYLYAGGIEGSAYGAITNSYNTGIVEILGGINGHAGGIVGEGRNTNDIMTCYNTGKVDVSGAVRGYAGGIVGYLDYYSEQHVTGSYNTGAVNINASYYAYAGGIIGTTFGNTAIVDSYNSGTVTAIGPIDYAGGLIGYVAASRCNISYSYNTGAISASYDYGYGICAGGIAGYISDGNITNSFNSGAVTATGANSNGNICVGGIVGYNNNIINISSVYNTGGVTASKSGISYSIYIGGIAGQVSGSGITNSYSAAVLGAGGSGVYTGGIAGYADSSCNISGVYYDKDKLPYSSGAIGSNNGLLLGAGLSTEQMTALDALSGAAAGLGGEFVKRAGANGIEYYPELRSFSGEATAEAASMLSAARSAEAIYKITYDYKGGAAEAYSALVALGGELTLAVPVREYYAFAGWFDADGAQYTGADGLGLFGWNETDKTLYARWTAAVEGIELAGKSDGIDGLDFIIPALCLLITVIAASGVGMLLKDRKKAARKAAAAPAGTAGAGGQPNRYGYDVRGGQELRAANGSQTPAALSDYDYGGGLREPEGNYGGGYGASAPSNLEAFYAQPLDGGYEPKQPYEWAKPFSLYDEVKPYGAYEQPKPYEWAKPFSLYDGVKPYDAYEQPKPGLYEELKAYEFKPYDINDPHDISKNDKF
jgi:hypothetical protein